MDRIIKSEIKKEQITGIPSVALHGIENSMQDDRDVNTDVEEDFTEEELELFTYQDSDTGDSDVSLTQPEAARSVLLSDAPMRKYPFKLKQSESG